MNGLTPVRFGHTTVNYFTPAMPAHMYKTYTITRPLITRPATCEEEQCASFTAGWVTLIDENTPLGKKQAEYIRHGSGRSFSEERTPEGLTRFLFPPGQKCFMWEEHRRVLVKHDPRYIIRGGDFRGNPLGRKPVVLSAQSWVDDFGEHQEKLAEAIQRG